MDASAVVPTATWGTTPADSAPLTGRVADGVDTTNPAERERIAAAMAYMGLEPGQPMSSVAIDIAFIGSCTNSRIEDLRAAADVLRGRRIAKGVRGLVVPGSTQVKRAAEAEGLAQVFVDAGFEWRESGCSMCIGMNGDSVGPGLRCASTSNRNFENRQGPGGRTHLLSPASVAASRAERPAERSARGGRVKRIVSSVIGSAAVLNRDDIDTDALFPAPYLRLTQRSGIGRYLFADWRAEGRQEVAFMNATEPPPSWSEPATSAVAPHASRPSGHSRTTAFKRCWRCRSATSSATTA